MKREKLSGRLSRLREGRKPVPTLIPKPASFSPGAQWKEVAPFVYSRDTHIPFPEKAFSRIKEPFFTSDGDFPDKMVFYDLETTGLGGGAGTLVFLAGFLTFCGGGSNFPGLSVRQLFLSDFPGEPDYLRVVSDSCPSHNLYVSYNGKSYDRHLLMGRCRMNRVPLSMPRQLDLLYMARKFWRRSVPDCSLGTIEKEILGVHRKLDIPGHEIPDRYFSWLKQNDPALLEPVFAHHLQDLFSLVLLYAHVESLAAFPERCSFHELGALGELFYSAGRHEGLDMLIKAAFDGNCGAGRRAIILLKRSGRREEAVRIADALWQSKRDLFAGIELAKFHEHVEKDYKRALSVVEKIIKESTPRSDRIERDLAHRRTRLAKLCQPCCKTE